MITVRSGAEERTFWGARLDVLNFRLSSYLSYSAEYSGPKLHKTLNVLRSGWDVLVISGWTFFGNAFFDVRSYCIVSAYGIRKSACRWRPIFSGSSQKAKCEWQNGKLPQFISSEELYSANAEMLSFIQLASLCLRNFMSQLPSWLLMHCLENRDYTSPARYQICRQKRKVGLRAGVHPQIFRCVNGLIILWLNSFPMHLPPVTLKPSTTHARVRKHTHTVHDAGGLVLAGITCLGRPHRSREFVLILAEPRWTGWWLRLVVSAIWWWYVVHDAGGKYFACVLFALCLLLLIWSITGIACRACHSPGTFFSLWHTHTHTHTPVFSAHTFRRGAPPRLSTGPPPPATLWKLRDAFLERPPR